MAMDPKNKDRVHSLVKSAYRRLDNALYKIQDGDDYVAKNELDDALRELKDAYRMM